MRTNIEIDDELMQKAMEASHAPTKKAAVEEALRLMVKIKGQSKLRELWGKIEWRGHDDDWFTSDEAILEKRRQAAQQPIANPTASVNDRNETFEPVGKQSVR
jgi:Arc/MetJ family transcription regulator